jgi:hypothetical protein
MVSKFSKTFPEFKKKEFSCLLPVTRDSFRVSESHRRCNNHLDILPVIFDRSLEATFLFLFWLYERDNNEDSDRLSVFLLSKDTVSDLRRGTLFKSETVRWERSELDNFQTGLSHRRNSFRGKFSYQTDQEARPKHSNSSLIFFARVSSPIRGIRERH